MFIIIIYIYIQSIYIYIVYTINKVLLFYVAFSECYICKKICLIFKETSVKSIKNSIKFYSYFCTINLIKFLLNFYKFL